MINDYKEVKECVYKDEHYSVRDNGAVMRHLREGKKVRRDDGIWTFGSKNPQNGYMMLGQHRVHIIVATAFLGVRDSKVYVVDHIDTNRCNNRVENLRWFTKLENALNNEITRNKIIYICGSIEAFIENPNILHERLRLVNEPSLEWMRTVTRDEAATAYENLKKYWAEQAQNPKPLVGGKMNDSVYRKETINPTQPTNNVAELETNIVKNNLQDTLRSAIIDVCKTLGYTVFEKHQGRGLKADVYIDANGQKYAFEIHAASQSLRTIRERQAKYIRDGITCCWLHEREKRNMGEEFEELPLFQFTQTPQGDFNISLKGRKTLTLTDFIRDLLNSRIKFCKHIRRSSKVGVKFLKMHCWNCGAENYIYHIWPLKSACNADIQYEDELWGADELMFHPEIVKQIKEYVNSDHGKHLPMGEIKDRYSRTIEESYMSFGCCECDAIFGEHYVKEAIWESLYHKEDVVEHLEIEVNTENTILEELPHWCHSSASNFCE